MFDGAGAKTIEVVSENGTHSVKSPEVWWSMVLGTGYRGTVDQLNAVDYEAVRLENLNFIQRAPVHAVEANVIYGVAWK